MSGKKNSWITLSRNVIYDNPWITMEEHEVINPSGQESIYGIVQFKNLAIGILPVDALGNVWLIGQHRYPIDAYTWEIPEGGGALNIPALESAKRELLEEAGLKANKWTLMQQLQLSNSVTDEIGFIFLAEELSEHIPDPDEDEDLTIKKMHFNEAYAMMESGEIKDALTVIALLSYKIRLLTS